MFRRTRWYFRPPEASSTGASSCRTYDFRLYDPSEHGHERTINCLVVDSWVWSVGLHHLVQIDRKDLLYNPGHTSGQYYQMYPLGPGKVSSGKVLARFLRYLAFVGPSCWHLEVASQRKICRNEEIYCRHIGSSILEFRRPSRSHTYSPEEIWILRKRPCSSFLDDVLLQSQIPLEVIAIRQPADSLKLGVEIRVWWSV